MVPVAKLDRARVRIFGVYVVAVDGAQTVLQPKQFCCHTGLSGQIPERALVVYLLVHPSRNVPERPDAVSLIVTLSAKPLQYGLVIITTL
jgi:hypothetical protein